MGQTTVVKTWDCIPEPEKCAALLMADASQTIGAFVPRSAMVLCFPNSPEFTRANRRNIFRDAYLIEEETIEVDGLEIIVWHANQAWMSDVWACFLVGDCVEEPPTCPQLNFYNVP